MLWLEGIRLLGRQTRLFGVMEGGVGRHKCPGESAGMGQTEAGGQVCFFGVILDSGAPILERKAKLEVSWIKYGAFYGECTHRSRFVWEKSDGLKCLELDPFRPQCSAQVNRDTRWRESSFRQRDSKWHLFLSCLLVFVCIIFLSNLC